MRSNEFKGASLAEAVRNATAAYRKPGIIKANSFCDTLIRRFDSKKIRADHILDRVTELEREVDNLRDAARAAGLAAALSALGAASGALGSLARVLRIIRRLRLGKATRRELSELVPIVGSAFSALISAFGAASALEQARRLEREVERLKAQYDNLTDELIEITEDYADSNCHLTPGIV